MGSVCEGRPAGICTSGARTEYVKVVASRLQDLVNAAVDHKDGEPATQQYAVAAATELPPLAVWLAAGRWESIPPPCIVNSVFHWRWHPIHLADNKNVTWSRPH